MFYGNLFLTLVFSIFFLTFVPMEQYSDLTYDMLPPSWLFCFLDGCPKADGCIRHITNRFIQHGRTCGMAVYPSALNADECEHFKPIRKIHAAYGFSTIFSEVRRKDDMPLRSKIKKYLGGHGTYYRYHNGEKLLTPEQQEWIINLFRSYGYTENLTFDHYRDVYDLD